MQSTKVFLAPDIFVAFLDRAHPKHLHASAFFRYFAQEQYTLYTNTTNIIETCTTITQTMSYALTKDFLKALQQSSINVLYPEDSDLRLAFKTMLSYESSELSMQEALMASMSSRRGILSICTLEYIHPIFGISSFYLPI